MTDLGLIGILLIAANGLFSYKAFSDQELFNKYKFKVDPILIGKQYIRMVSSGFLHLDWSHLLGNMLTLFFFAGIMETKLGSIDFLLVYFVSLLAGSGLSLLVHKQHGDYSAVGASGAVSGIVFGAIVLFPGMDLKLFLIPISFPSWLFGLAYIGYSIYGVQTKKGNIGHDAHLGGALGGILISLILKPEVIVQNTWVIALVSVPALIFVLLVVFKPNILLFNSFKRKPLYKEDIDAQFNSMKRKKQKELDALLDKIGKKGMSGLTKAEKKRLEELSS